jgi:hypothetical protein
VHSSGPSQLFTVCTKLDSLLNGVKLLFLSTLQALQAHTEDGSGSALLTSTMSVGGMLRAVESKLGSGIYIVPDSSGILVPLSVLNFQWSEALHHVKHFNCPRKEKRSKIAMFAKLDEITPSDADIGDMLNSALQGFNADPIEVRPDRGPTR